MSNIRRNEELCRIQEEEWTELDWEHHRFLRDVLEKQGWAAYCAVIDAENEALMAYIKDQIH
jgi:hypothetical protein